MQKKDNFEPWKSKAQGKHLTKNKSWYINKTQIKVCFLKSLPWLVNRNLCLKIIFLSQYSVQKYRVLRGPNLDLEVESRQMINSGCKITK